MLLNNSYLPIFKMLIRSDPIYCSALMFYGIESAINNCRNMDVLK